MATKETNAVFIGTELKLNIHIDNIEDITMDDYDFEVELYCSPKKSITVAKSSAIRIDESNYVVLVDTNIIGAGELKCKVSAQIPDGDLPDNLRTEIVGVETGINIVKAI